ncbi:MAG: hypothetical protein LUH47_02895 [Clostridiales bacterium]|nr:hypothetical protein [Clostridiales bacterium]
MNKTTSEYRSAITTIDNPFDPFDEFTSWFLYDEEKGYHTCGYLARIAKTSNQFTDKENDLEVEKAIDEIIKYDFMNIYKKVKRKADETKIES